MLHHLLRRRAVGDLERQGLLKCRFTEGDRIATVIDLVEIEREIHRRIDWDRAAGVDDVAKLPARVRYA